MELPKDLKSDISDYCRVNNITNIDEFTIKLIKQGFTIEKFGATPVIKTVEKIVEKRVEVPVTMEDSEISENLKKYMGLYEESQEELRKALETIDSLKKVTDNKNKKDIYGE